MNTTRLNLNVIEKQLGVAAVEFALLITLLLIIAAGTVEFGRTFWYYDALTKATRDGARFVSNSKSTNPATAVDSNIKEDAVDMVVNAAKLARVPDDFNAGYVNVSCEDSCDNPQYVTVSIDNYPVVIGEWIPFVTFFGKSGWSVKLSPYTTMPYMR